MVDRVYKAGVPEYRQALEQIRKEFARLDPSIDWVGLRVDPVLAHARELERRAHSRKFSREFSRLRKGVPLFHSDLVYLRTNVVELRRLLESERRRKPGSPK